jgi:hypothetical protein
MIAGALGNRHWWRVEELDITVCTPPKNASSTLHLDWADHGYTVYEPKEVVDGIFLVRPPLERFMSLWRSKCRDGVNLTVGDDINPIKDFSCEDLISMIERGDKHDSHWAHQTEIEKGLATTLVPVGIIDQWYYKLTGRTPAPANQTEHRPSEHCTPEVAKRVRKHYEDDTQLYNAAWNDPSRAYCWKVDPKSGLRGTASQP